MRFFNRYSSPGLRNLDLCSYLGVVGPLVGHVEGGLDGAPVRVLATGEKLLVKFLEKNINKCCAAGLLTCTS